MIIRSKNANLKNAEIRNVWRDSDLKCVNECVLKKIKTNQNTSFIKTHVIAKLVHLSNVKIWGVSLSRLSTIVRNLTP